MLVKDKITYSSLRDLIAWSPTGFVLYKTPSGWSIRKDTAVLVTERAKTPRVWKDVDFALEQMKLLGVKELKVEL